MQGGTEWLIDAVGCQPERLSTIVNVRALCELVIHELTLKVIGEGHWHQFPDPGGVTGMYLLTESHLACHTYPEAEMATFNLYCCRHRPDWEWEQHLTKALGAREVRVRKLSRDARDFLVSESIVSDSLAAQTPHSSPTLSDETAGGPEQG